MNSEIPHNTREVRGSAVQRVGGGINVAVIPIDTEHPERTTEQVRDYIIARAACRMAFDDQDEQTDMDFSNILEI